MSRHRHRFEAYLDKVFGFSDLVSALPEGRQFPQHSSGARADDLYVVCGQAEKSAKWTWSFENLVRHLLIRENEHRRGRPTRFIRGSAQELVTLRKSARRKFVVFRVGIVQPGLSKANAPAEHLAIIGGTNGFIRCITDEPLTVYASD